ncbi:4-amino-4-deoxy-L-arabinose transferase-like glycosyltransferase [Pseudoxanthomonas sacheonensis]|uniref:4-amino-4-deoxy-L-arabinose transferase-like glycosyltransferase n=1 Tax=Pseudoxanthomonas sacheonensis TaxID=443615 RepID=A0ABU1RPE1_9GAMM|nr:4-amino-4-deoxy-L-arabinose transferase-like glycosyltransferase [Pseudoxanthomonas sacheonensis]
MHVPSAPSLWPPAPGWWLLAGAIALAVAIAWWIRRKRRRRLLVWQKLFDDACSDAAPAAQVAAISELLRRAARRVNAKADHLQNEDWLRLLDGQKQKGFSEGAGRLLLEGGYRREVPADDFAAAKALARARFLELMAGQQ